jgi:hypothetical protein
LVEGLEDGVEAGGDEGGHVEGGAGGGPAVGDVSLASTGAAVVVVGGDAGEGGGLAALQGAEFGQDGQEGAGGGVAEALHEGEAPDFAVELGAGGLVPGDLGVELLEVFLEAGVEALGGFGDEGVAVVFMAVAFALEEILEFAAAGDEFGQALMGWVGHGIGRGLKASAVVGEDGGIDGVGLGEVAAGAGVVADQAGVEAADGDAGLVEGLEEEVFVAAGGFADDVDAGDLREVAEELAVAGAGVVVAGVLEDRMGTEVEGEFGDVEAEMDGRGHGIGGRQPLRGCGGLGLVMRAGGE